MCLNPVLIKFENPNHKRIRCADAIQKGDPFYTYKRKYSKGLPTNTYTKKVDYGFKSCSHLVSVPVGIEKTFEFNEPLPDTCDSRNYPFPSESYMTKYKDIIGYDSLSMPCTGTICKNNAFAEPELCMYVPCGKCVECVTKFKNAVTDLVHRDIQACKNVCSFFVTLTYDPSHLPTDTDLAKHAPNDPVGNLVHCSTGFLHRPDLTNYIKRLRITLYRWYGVTDVRIVYCGEYGKDTTRPHYHLLIWFEHTDKTLKGYSFDGCYRGKPSLFTRYIKSTKRVPPLHKTTFSAISYHLWHMCAPIAHRVEVPRSPVAVGEYICKYLLKTKCPDKVSHLVGKFAPTAIPCFFRISINIGKNVLRQFMTEDFLKRGTFFKVHKGVTTEVPINPRIMRKISRILYRAGFSDYFIERQEYMSKFILKPIETLVNAYNRLNGTHLDAPSLLRDPLSLQLLASIKREIQQSSIDRQSTYLFNTINSSFKYE